MTDRRAGVLGATSIVGERLLPMLVRAGWQIDAFSRAPGKGQQAGVQWRQIGTGETEKISDWVSLVPIGVLADQLPWLEGFGVKRIVAVSSTSRFSKENSSDLGERESVRRLVESEARLISWAEARGVEWTILRPTLIYGLGRDSNITEIARLIRRYRFFPLLGEGSGRRQPIHAGDVAWACARALATPLASRKSYNISGDEILTYREMIERIFTAMGMRPRFISVPLTLFQWAVSVMSHIPRYRFWTVAMVERMNRDLVFGHSEAERDLGFRPKGFVLGPDDLPAE